MASMSQESRDPPWPVIQNLAQEELTLHAKAHHLESIPGRSKRILAATCKGSAICYASMCFSFLEFLQLRSKPYQYGTVITEVPPRFLAPNQLSSRAQFMENIRRGWILLVHLVKCPVPQADSRMGSFRITFGTKNANTSPKFNWETKCCKAFTSCLPTSWKDFILDVNPRLLPWQASSPKVRLLFFEDSSTLSRRIWIRTSVGTQPIQQTLLPSLYQRCQTSRFFPRFFPKKESTLSKRSLPILSHIPSIWKLIWDWPFKMLQRVLKHVWWLSLQLPNSSDLKVPHVVTMGTPMCFIG